MREMQQRRSLDLIPPLTSRWPVYHDCHQMNLLVYGHVAKVFAVFIVLEAQLCPLDDFLTASLSPFSPLHTCSIKSCNKPGKKKFQGRPLLILLTSLLRKCMLKCTPLEMSPRTARYLFHHLVSSPLNTWKAQQSKKHDAGGCKQRAK